MGNLYFISQGTFTQGSPQDEYCRWPLEDSFIHTITQDTLVMETEITRQMWNDLKALQPNLPVDPSDVLISPGANHPIQNIQWYEAELYANLLSQEQGLTPCYYKDASFATVLDASNYNDIDVWNDIYNFCNFDANGYRLPTEGEWEYFTRAGTTGPFSIEDPNYWNITDCFSCNPGELPNVESVATICANSEGRTSEAGSKNPNPWGLKDVHGNVYEYCWDWYSSSYPIGPVIDYRGPETGSDRIVRGGSWDQFNPSDFRSAFRTLAWPGTRGNNLGFRLVRTYP